MTFKPMSISVSGHLLATGQNVYSTGCNANWTEGTLTSYAMSLGYTLLVETETVDSHANPQYEECTSFPGEDWETTNWNWPSIHCWNAPWGYGGSTGWPAYTDMVDGTHNTNSLMEVCDSHGNLIEDPDGTEVNPAGTPMTPGPRKAAIPPGGLATAWDSWY